MIRIKVLNHDFDYKGKISIRIDNVFVHISALGYTDALNSEHYSWDYNIHDVFLTEDVESITGLSND